MAYRPPTGTQLVGSSDPFVMNDGGRWFVAQNHDYEDRDGNMGMSTEYVGDPLKNEEPEPRCSRCKAPLEGPF